MPSWYSKNSLASDALLVAVLVFAVLGLGTCMFSFCGEKVVETTTVASLDGQSEDEFCCLHEGRNLVAREVVVGSTHVRIRFEPDTRVVRKR